MALLAVAVPAVQEQNGAGVAWLWQGAFVRVAEDTKIFLFEPSGEGVAGDDGEDGNGFDDHEEFSGEVAVDGEAAVFEEADEEGCKNEAEGMGAADEGNGYAAEAESGGDAFFVVVAVSGNDVDGGQACCGSADEHGGDGVSVGVDAGVVGGLGLEAGGAHFVAGAGVVEEVPGDEGKGYGADGGDVGGCVAVPAGEGVDGGQGCGWYDGGGVEGGGHGEVTGEEVAGYALGDEVEHDGADDFVDAGIGAEQGGYEGPDAAGEEGGDGADGDGNEWWCGEGECGANKGCGERCELELAFTADVEESESVGNGYGQSGADEGGGAVDDLACAVWCGGGALDEGGGDEEWVATGGGNEEGAEHEGDNDGKKWHEVPEVPELVGLELHHGFGVSVPLCREMGCLLVVCRKLRKRMVKMAVLCCAGSKARMQEG